jgi:hypothetical protein
MNYAVLKTPIHSLTHPQLTTLDLPFISGSGLSGLFYVTLGYPMNLSTLSFD